MAPPGDCWLSGFATRWLDPISLGTSASSIDSMKPISRVVKAKRAHQSLSCVGMVRRRAFAPLQLRRPHGAFVFAHQRQPLVLGGGECIYGGGAFLAEDRDPRRIAVIELGVGQRRVDLGDFFA